MSLTKFYHYNVWIEDGNGQRLDPTSVTADLFIEDDFHIMESDGMNYYTQFSNLRPDQYYGILMRTEDENGFLRRSEESNLSILSDETDGEGETGSIDRSHVNFGICVDGITIKLLIEQGFQTPGIGLITNYIQQHITTDDDLQVKHENAVPDLTDEEVDELLNRELKKVKVSFKKHPKLVENLGPEDSAKQIIPDDYRLKFEVSLESGKEKEEKEIADYMDDFIPMLGTNHDSTRESIKQIDFPDIMHTFRVTGLEGDDEIETNLARVTNKEEVDITNYGIYSENLGNELCERVENRR